MIALMGLVAASALTLGKGGVKISILGLENGFDGRYTPAV
jgi:hypothetical protein